jgi:hypothetical protein
MVPVCRDFREYGYYTPSQNRSPHPGIWVTTVIVEISLEWVPLVQDKRLFQLVKGLEISIEVSQSQD